MDDTVREYGCHKVFTELSCAIGSPEVDAVCLNCRGQVITQTGMDLRTTDLIHEFGLDKPGFRQTMQEGPFS